jgi:protoporphyrinogen oxidase
MIAIIGAGMTGLSAAYHLKDREYVVFEKEEEAGGLCRSIEKDGFTFDYTGHFLHLHHPYTKKLTEEILPGELNRINRRAFIYLQRRYVPYPFQAHTFVLPPEVRRECVMGFIEAQNQKGSTPNNFLDWIYQTFGEGMARYFFTPYNEKLWRIDLRELTYEWTSWSVPQPTMEQVLKGATGFKNDQMGYNPSFLYPRRGGIGLFTRGLLSRVKNVQLGKAVKAISMKEKRLSLEGGEEMKYSSLISTCPLPQLLRLIEDLPSDLKKAGEQLRYLSVLNLNLGIARDNVSDCHWIYFPEKEFPFYRTGFFSNLSYTLAPPHTSSMYVEITQLPQEQLDDEVIVKDVLKGLMHCGILNLHDDLATLLILRIPYAYVVYDQFRRENLPSIHKFLRSKKIFSIGRYGAWEYSTMEGAILQGKWVAEKLQR